jgi:opacity protein-like surface antigen
MKKIITSALAATAILTAGGNIVPAAPVVETVQVFTPWTGLYVGGALTANQTYLKGESDWFGTSVNNKTAYGIQGDAGYTFFNNGDIALSAEGRFGGSFGGDDFVETSYWGIYAKPEAIFGDFSAYALLGYGELDYTRSGDIYEGSPVTYAYTTTTDGFTWGVGAQYAVSSNVGVYVDYVVQPTLDVVGLADGGAVTVVTEDNVETDVISVGFNYKF